METWANFVNVHTCKETLATFHKLKEELRLLDVPYHDFTDQLCSKLNRWKEKQMLQRLKKKISPRQHEKVLVVGCGPCGLRTAIEAAFLGYHVVVIDKRTAFTRNNVLHLWPFLVTDLRGLEMKYFYGIFGCGELYHISIRRLQISLLKIALVLGIEVYTGVEFEGLVQPENERSWRAVCKPTNHVVSGFEFDVLISATGARDALADITIFDSKRHIVGKKSVFDRKELRGKLAIAITANFVNSNTKEEIKAEEVGGVASHFRQDFFRELKRKTKIDLENIVYYKDETHYFVMTAKKSSLLERGVFKFDFSDAQDLMNKTNIDVPALLSYARDAANFCTKNVMPNLKFALNHHGKEDVSMLDFSSKYEAVNACRVLRRNGRPILIGLVGDSLLEPFWPTGSGCARGFLGAMDAAWMMKKWAVDKANPLGLVMERECIYKLLSQATTDNLKKKYSEYTVDPTTRYAFVNRKAVNRNQARNFCDETDTKLDECEEEGEDVIEVPTMKTNTDVKEEDVDIKEELLRWCQDVLGRYPNINIQNLTTSWRDGYAICALVYTFRPDLLDLKSIKRYNARSRLSFIVELAQREFGISPTMTIAEMLLCTPLNEMAMVAYLRQFYDQFAEEQVPAKSEDTPLSPALVSVLSPIDDTFEDISKGDENVAKPLDSKSSSGVCYFCKQRLYITERICAEDIFFHQSCLKCKRCGVQLYSKKYRSRRSATGEVTFYCERHSNPKLNFASSVRKISAIRGFASSRGLSQPDKPTGKKPPVPPKPNLPRRPDFLSRPVTSASRRIEFYNAADDPEPEEKAEDKVFEHNFGASVRKGIGAFSIHRIKQMANNEPNESSSSGDEESTDIDDQMTEAIEDRYGENVNKNMTIKDAKSFLETFRAKVKEWEEESKGTGSGSSTESSDTETSNEDVSESPVKADTEKARRESKKRRNLERFSAGLEELEKEQKDLLKEKASTRAWMTMYRPSIETTEHSQQKPETNIRPKLKRQVSDPSIARRAQRVQFAARKLARENEQNRLFEAQELQRQLEEAEIRRQEIERRGIQIEKHLEESRGENDKENSSLRKELFTLSVRRQELLKYESDLHSFRSQFEELENFDELPELQSLSLSEMNEELNKLSDDDEVDDLEKTLRATCSSSVIHKNSHEERLEKGDIGSDNNLEKTIIGHSKKSYGSHANENTSDNKCDQAIQSDSQSDNDLVKTVRGNSNHEVPGNGGDVTLPDGPNQMVEEVEDMKTTSSSDVCMEKARDETIIHIPDQATCNMATAQLQDMLNSMDNRKEAEGSGTGCGATGNTGLEEDITEDESVDTIPEVLTTAEDTWECAYCTLLNKDDWSYCDACEAWRCTLCTFINEYRRKKCDMCFNQRPERQSRHVTLNHQSEDSYV